MSDTFTIPAFYERGKNLRYGRRGGRCKALDGVEKCPLIL